MSESYEKLLAALRDGTAFVCLDVQPPRDAPTKQFVAYLFEPAPGDRAPRGGREHRGHARASARAGRRRSRVEGPGSYAHGGPSGHLIGSRCSQLEPADNRASRPNYGLQKSSRRIPSFRECPVAAIYL